MDITTSPLEEWLREYYFTSDIDLGCSGVEDFSLAKLRQLVGITQDEMDRVVFRDSESCGAPALRKAIAERWGNGDANHVMATTGSSEAIFLVTQALLRPGDEVIVVDPCYPSLVYIAEALRCRMKYWQLRFEDQFVPDLNVLKKLVGSSTRMVIVNFPHNPTGAALTLEQQAELIEIVSKREAFLVWDAAFAELTYQRPPLPDATLKYERAISIGTLSKAYGLPGLRVGWCLATPDVLKQCMYLRDYTTLYLSPLIELLALRAIEKADLLLGLRLEQAQRNLEILAQWVERHHEFIDWVVPQGGVTAFVRFKQLKNVEAFCHRLAQQHKVLLVPGSCFKHPAHARLGFGGPTAAFQQGLSHMSNLLATFRA
jgi:capreomycidine synthase